jgi:hypothetical protein
VNGDVRCELEVGLRKEGEKEFIESFKSLGEVRAQRIEGSGPENPEWRIGYPEKPGFTKRVQELLSMHDHSIWNVYRVDRLRPDFSGEPDLTPLPAHEAAFFLLRELKRKPAFVERQNESGTMPGSYFTEIIRLLEDVSCYRLKPGKLELMDALIRRVVDAGGGNENP